jgi:hypothetical protein
MIGLVSLGIVVCLGSPARADGIAYASSKCSSNPHGMIYVAAGRHVYHLPFENLRYVHGVSFETAARLPVPPRPSEPNGCPDHPLRGIGFKFSPFSDVTHPAPAETEIGGFVQLVEIDPSSSWDTYERYALSNPDTCAAGDWSATGTTPGLTMCWPAAARSADRSIRFPFAAIVDPQRYAGPLGQPLAILCSPNRSAGADDYACEISYRLDQDLIVWYDFRTSFIPLSGLIDFDRELRRRIAEAEIPDYGWPILSIDRPTAPH